MLWVGEVEVDGSKVAGHVETLLGGCKTVGGGG